MFLWMIFDIVGLDGVFGSMGMVGLMAVVALHSLGILTTEDWHGMQVSLGCNRFFASMSKMRGTDFYYMLLMKIFI